MFEFKRDVPTNVLPRRACSGSTLGVTRLSYDPLAAATHPTPLKKETSAWCNTMRCLRRKKGAPPSYLRSAFNKYKCVVVLKSHLFTIYQAPNYHLCIIHQIPTSYHLSTTSLIINHGHIDAPVAYFRPTKFYADVIAARLPLAPVARQHHTRTL